MSTYNVNRAKHVALVAATVDTVNFAYSGSSCRVHNHDSTADIYFTIDGTTPTAAGDDTYYVAPGTSVVVNESIVATVKLISTGTPTYSAELY